MHEITLVTSLMEIVKDAAQANGFSRVTEVRLKVGELSGVEPMTLAACFEVVAEGTVAAGARLVIEPVPLRGSCRKCGERFAIAGFRFACPACGADAVRVEGGKELYIDTLEGTCEGEHHEATAA